MNRIPLLASLAVLAVAVSAQPQGKTRFKPVPPIGSISGTITWTKGQIRVPPPFIAPGHAAPTLQSEIDLHAAIVRVTPSTKPGVLGTTTTTQLNPVPKYGKIVTSGTTMSVTYTVDKLPLNVPLQIVTRPKHGGSFQSSIPGGVTLSLYAMTSTTYNLRYQEPPR